MGVGHPNAVRRAARIADGWMGSGGSSIAEFKASVPILKQELEKAGRDPAAMPIGFHVNAWVSPDGALPESVRAAMWHQIGTYAMWHAADDGDPSPTMPPIDDDRLRERTFLGTPAEVVAQASPWVEELGHRELHVIFRLHYPGMRRDEAEPAMRLFVFEFHKPALSGLGASRY